MLIPDDRPDTDHPDRYREWRWQWRCERCRLTWATAHGAAPQSCPACGAPHDGQQEASELVEYGGVDPDRVIYRKLNRRGE